MKRSFLDDLLGKLSSVGVDGAGGQNGGPQTITETVRQTITVGGSGLGGPLNTSVPTVTATATITVTEIAEGIAE